MKNWITTLFGTLCGVSTVIAQTVPDPRVSKWATLASGLFAALLGAGAKDHNVTGGTKDQTKPQ
jgi:hypothetical protein